jgi:hypothetical protein
MIACTLRCQLSHCAHRDDYPFGRLSIAPATLNSRRIATPTHHPSAMSAHCGPMPMPTGHK